MTTNAYKRIITGADFLERIEKGKLGIEALNEIMEEQIEKAKGTTPSDSLVNSILDKMWDDLTA